MDQVKFRETRDRLNSDPKTKHYMIKYGDGSWGWGDIHEDSVPPVDEDLEGIETNVVSPDGFENGNLVGFIYISQNCPGILFYGKRTEEEQKILKYIWKQNHGNSNKESDKDRG